MQDFDFCPNRIKFYLNWPKFCLNLTKKIY